jgi:hypothetical protein
MRGSALCLALLLSVALPGKVWAARGAGGYSPILELGVNFHVGDTGKSLTGAQGYFMTIRAEKSRSVFRMHGAMDIQYAGGTASVGTDSPSFTLYGAAFLGGVHIAPFQESKFSPFFGGSGVFAWEFLKMPTPPTGVEPQTQSLSFGYETSVGVDIRTRNDGTALRLRSGYYAVTGSLAGVSGFQLSGFRFTLGFVW